MARLTGDPFIDAVYDGIPTEVVDQPIFSDLNVKYGVPFDPGSCGPCRAAGAGLGEETSLWRQTLPVWGTLLVVGVVLVPLIAWQMMKEREKGVW